MQTYDLFMIAVLLCATVFGFWKGMAWQIASLASLVVSYFAALKFSAQLAPTFGDHAPWNRFIAMLVIYAVTSFVIWTLFRLVSGVIDKVRLEAFDKQLGAMIGFAKGVLLCVLITFAAVTFLPASQGQMIVDSQSGHYIVALLNKADTVVPPELHQVIDPYLQQVQERLNPGYQAGSPSGTAQPQSQFTWPKISWPGSSPPQSTPQIAWPQQSAPQQPASQQGQSQPIWPSQPQATSQVDPYAVPRSQADPYAVPREPKPFADPYSAERPASGTY